MSHDEDKRPLRPIPGAPPGAPNPPFPEEKPKHQPEPKEPEPKEPAPQEPAPKEPEPDRARGPDSVPSPNEIAARLEDLKKRQRYADKLGLETVCEISKLLVIMVDVHKYEGKRYVSFAIAHGAGNRSDAYALYRLGLVADDVILKCEAEERINPRFQYPHWRKMVPPKPKDEEETVEPDEDEPDEDEPAEPDPVSELRRERDNLEAQVEAATQQYRNERAKREEAEERHVVECQQFEAKIISLKAWTAAGIPACGSEKGLWERPIRPSAPAAQSLIPPSIDVVEDDGEPLLPATGHPTPPAVPYVLRNRGLSLATIKDLEHNNFLTGWRGHGEHSRARQLRADFLHHWREIEQTLHAPQSLTLLKADFWEKQDGASFDDLITKLPANEAPRSENGD